MPDDKKDRRYEILDKIIEIFSHGTCKIKWADKTIVEIEEVEVKQTKVIK